MNKIKLFENFTGDETIEFAEFLLKNCYIHNNTKWEYRGTYYSTEELFDKYKQEYYYN